MRDGRLLNKKSRGANAIMSSTYGTAGQEARSEAASYTAGTPDRASMVRAGLIGGLAAGIHFLFALAWGVLFAFLWPIFRRRGYEATLVALFYAVVIWIVMHAAIMVATTSHPDYFDPMVVIGGFMSHFFYTVPLALIVKQRLAPDATG